MEKVSNYRMLSIKDIQTLLECSERTAKRFKKDIQEEFNLQNKPILFIHFKRYTKTD